jgi:hypothetical protein
MKAIVNYSGDYRMRIFTKKQLEDVEISVIVKEIPTPGFG